jgi:hypothetical protein
MRIDYLPGQIFLDVFSQELPPLPFFVGCAGIDDAGDLICSVGWAFGPLHAILYLSRAYILF